MRAGQSTEFQIVVALRGARPRVWRRVLVRGDTLLSELSDVLQVVTGAAAELHAFSLPGKRLRSASRDCFVTDVAEHHLRLADLAGEGTRLHYECVGDICRRYRLDVETVRPLETDVGYPVCLAGRLASPGAPAHDDFDLGLVNQRLAAFQRLPGTRQREPLPTAAQRRRARAELGSALARFPADPADLRARLAGLDRRAVRDELVLWVDKPESFKARLLVVEAFMEVGLGHAVGDLQAIALDVKRPVPARGLAFEVLSLGEPTATARVLGALEPRQRELLLEDQFQSLLVATQVDPDAAVLVAQTIADQVALGDHDFLSFLEGCRAAVGVPPGVVYGEALRCPGLTPVRARLLDILVRAGGSQVAALLERVRDETMDATWRNRLQRALLGVLNSIAARRRTPAVGGRAWTSACDAQGRFVVLAHIQAPRGGSFASVTARLDGGLYAAELVPRTSLDEARRRVRDFAKRTRSEVSGISLDEAAARLALVARSAREHSVEIPRATSAVVELIESAWSRAPLSTPAG